MNPIRVGLAVLLTGCVVVENPIHEELSSDGVSWLVGDLERGSLEYRGRQTTEVFTISGTSRGTGSKRSKAEEREGANYWDIEVVEGALQIETGTPERGRVDLAVVGPRQLDLDVIVESGNVELRKVEGNLFVTAGEVVATEVVGDLDFFSRSGGIEVQAVPWEDGEIHLDSRSGSVELGLPYGYDYDIEIWGDPEYAMTVADLGFTNSFLGEGYFSGEAGYATIEVVVHVTGGTFELYQTY